MAHGMTAFGPSFASSTGKLAADVIVSNFAQITTPQTGDAGLPAGKAATFVAVHFDDYGPDGTPIEPHSNLITKTFVLSGMPMSRKFKVGNTTLTVQQMVTSVKSKFVHDVKNPVYWPDIAWTLDLLSHTSKPGERWVNAQGTTISIDAVMNDALDQLERDTAELAAGLKNGLPQVDKRKQGLYAHSCGGLHFVQAVLSWARFAPVKKAWGARVDQQIAILVYRLDSEKRQYDAAFAQAPEYRLPVLVQMVKFYGHYLETTARLRDELGWQPTDPQQQSIAKARAMLDWSVRELEALDTWGQLDSIKRKQRQVYLDLIGDSCHATHGLDAWR